MREFVATGGELIIHGALHSKNSLIPELSIIAENFSTLERTQDIFSEIIPWA